MDPQEMITKRNKFFSLWERENKSGILVFFLRFLSAVYLLGYAIRKFFYHIRLIKAKELNAKVISIGNITLGGSGKTPFVLYLSKKLNEKGINFAILTRGYGRSSKTTKELKRISAADVKWEEVGDEPFLLSSHLPEVPLIVDKDRYYSGKIALDKYKSNVLILDDGFQHWRLKRDLDIMMVDSSVDLETEKLFPAGRLREPLSSIKRAGIFILSRVNQSSNKDKIKALLQKLNPQAPIAESILEVTSVLSWKDKTEIELKSLKGKKGLAFCGIGNPYSFERTLKSMGIEILNAFFFMDHYIYTRKEFISLEEEGKKQGVDFLITTEKDSIRLPEIKELRIPLLVVKVELKIISGEKKLWEVLNL